MADEPESNPAAAFQALLAKNNNDATGVASKLFDENYQLRVKNRELTDKAPKDGALVLSADDAKKWTAYEAIGIEPKELKKASDKVLELEKTNKELAGMETLRELADVGLDGSKLKLSVLKDQLTKFPDAAIRFETQKDKDGKESKVAFIKHGDKESPFSTFAAENLADYLPALKVSAEAAPIVHGNTGDPNPAGGPSSFFDGLKSRLTNERKETASPVVDIDARFGRPAQAA